jgi:hypothetical protein
VKYSFQSVSSFWTLCHRKLRVKLVFTFVFFARLLAVALASRCATKPAGIVREERIYSMAANVVAHAQKIAPSLPQPVRSATEACPLLVAFSLVAF